MAARSLPHLTITQIMIYSSHILLLLQAGLTLSLQTLKKKILTSPHLMLQHLHKLKKPPEISPKLRTVMSHKLRVSGLGELVLPLLLAMQRPRLLKILLESIIEFKPGWQTLMSRRTPLMKIQMTLTRTWILRMLLMKILISKILMMTMIMRAPPMVLSPLAR